MLDSAALYRENFAPLSRSLISKAIKYDLSPYALSQLAMNKKSAPTLKEEQLGRLRIRPFSTDYWDFFPFSVPF